LFRRKEIVVKKSLVAILVLSLTLLFAVGCTSDEEVESSAPAEIAIESEDIQLFVDNQNAALAPLNSDEMTIVVRAEGTALIYTHIFGPDGFSEQEIQEMFDRAIADGDGDMLLLVAQMTVPEVTTVTIEFIDSDGNVLHTQDFSS